MGGFSSQHLDYRGGLLHAPWDPERLEAWGEETVIRRGVLNRRLDSLSHLEYNYINVYHWWKTSCSNMSTDSLWALGFEHRTIHLGFEHETTRLLSKISGVDVEILLDISSQCSFYRRSVSGDEVLHTWCNSRAWPKRLHYSTSGDLVSLNPAVCSLLFPVWLLQCSVCHSVVLMLICSNKFILSLPDTWIHPGMKEWCTSVNCVKVVGWEEILLGSEALSQLMRVIYTLLHPSFFLKSF